MGAALAVILFFWLLPIIVGQLIGGRKNRAGWAYGLLLGWLGVLIVALRDPKISVVTAAVAVPAAPLSATVVTSRAYTEPATVTLPSRTDAEPAAIAPAPEPPSRVMPPAGWYNDPQSPGSLRWWDGTGWTQFTNSASGSAPLAAS